MNKPEKYAGLKNTRFGQKLVFVGISASLIFAVVATWMLYPVRNYKPDDVAVRFIKNNDDIRSEVGEITKIVGFGLNVPDRSTEIAQRLKNGEKLFDENAAKENGKSQAVLNGDKNGSRRSGKLIGSKKTIEVQLYLKRYDYVKSGISYYKVAEAKYRDETG